MKILSVYIAITKMSESVSTSLFLMDCFYNIITMFNVYLSYNENNLEKVRKSKSSSSGCKRAD